MMEANRPKPATGRPKRKLRGTAFVRRREPPTAVVEHAADQSPDCGTKLTGGWERWRRQVYELLHVEAQRRALSLSTVIWEQLRQAQKFEAP